MELDIFTDVVAKSSAVEALPLPPHPFAPPYGPQYTAAVRLTEFPQIAFWVHAQSRNLGTKGALWFPWLPNTGGNTFQCVCACCGTDTSTPEEKLANLEFFEAVRAASKEWGVKALFARAALVAVPRRSGQRRAGDIWKEVTEFESTSWGRTMGEGSRNPWLRVCARYV
jgi:hypothetical protein